MAVTSLDKEISAIKTIVEVLEPLDSHVRNVVIDYVFKRLNIQYSGINIRDFESKIVESSKPKKEDHDDSMSKFSKKHIHIRELKEDKKPKSAIEMAVLVAYYVSEVAADSEKKETIVSADLTKYFRMAGFKLPGSVEFTLQNAKKAGYLDSKGRGEYRLNAVGYNLIEHNLPRT
jgi:hypothetical protein